MNDSEIIKGLQRMSNEDPDGFSSDVLALINRQQAEIDRLNIELKAMRGAANSWKAEVQRICKREFDNIEIDIEAIKSEAIREFAEKLKNKCRDSVELDDYRSTVVTKSDIDNLVKEMGCNDG